MQVERTWQWKTWNGTTGITQVPEFDLRSRSHQLAGGRLESYYVASLPLAVCLCSIMVAVFDLANDLVSALYGTALTVNYAWALFCIRSAQFTQNT